MKKIIGQSTLFCAIIASLLFTQFASNAQQKYKGEKIEKLLIIVLVENLENRKTLADELKYVFSDYGVKATPSHTTSLRVPKNMTKENTLAVCKKGGYDGLLLVKLVNSEQENSYSYNQRSQYTSSGMPAATSTGIVVGKGGTYSWGQYAFGNYFDAVNSTKVEIQTDLFKINKDYTKEQMIFAEDTKSRVGESEEAIGKFAKVIVKKIIKKNLLVISEN